MSLMDAVNLVKITTIPNLAVDSPTKQIYTKNTQQIYIYKTVSEAKTEKQRYILDEWLLNKKGRP